METSEVWFFLPSFFINYHIFNLNFSGKLGISLIEQELVENNEEIAQITEVTEFNESEKKDH